MKPRGPASPSRGDGTDGGKAVARLPDGMSDPSDGTGGPDGGAGGDEGESEGERERGTYLVSHTDAESTVVEDVESGQVHTLAGDPGGEREELDGLDDLEPGDVLTATLAPEPPLEVTWRLAAVHDRRRVRVEVSDEPPTRQARELAAANEVGDLARQPRAGTGELHVLTVPPGESAAAAREVADDEATLSRAARMDGIERVEIRHGDGVVSVRYLP